MNSFDVPIQKAPLTKINQITNIKIRVVSLKLFTNVTLSVLFMNDENNIVDNKIIILEGLDYTNWGNDDNYIKNIVLSKLGYTTL